MEEIAKKLASELGLSVEAVINAYKAYWAFIREKIKELPLKKNLSEEDFNYLKTNFNLPSMGKLNCTYDDWERKHSKVNSEYYEDVDEYY
jgi:hypothetical protein